MASGGYIKALDANSSEIDYFVVMDPRGSIPKWLVNWVGGSQIFIKRDDVAGAAYGGNKVRKLEFILAEKLAKDCSEVLTFGFAGSNHALATAVYAHQVQLNSILVLLDQPNCQYVRRNLKLYLHYRSELHHAKPSNLLWLLPKIIRRHRRHYQARPRIIHPGGTCPEGILGYVNAIFELKEQIQDGLLPEPDCIYVPLGTMGTAIGILLGIKLAKLKTKLVTVLVVDHKYYNEKRFVRLFHKTLSFMQKRDPSIPLVNLSEEDFEVKTDCLGQGYAHFTPETYQSLEKMYREEGILLEGTYSGKTLTGLINDIKGEKWQGKNILFWNTYNSKDLKTFANKYHHRQLPAAFHHYYTNSCQRHDFDETVENGL